jgi:hypothetical protein
MRIPTAGKICLSHLGMERAHAGGSALAQGPAITLCAAATRFLRTFPGTIACWAALACHCPNTLLCLETGAFHRIAITQSTSLAGAVWPAFALTLGCNQLLGCPWTVAASIWAHA